MTIDEMFAHFVECQNSSAVDRYLESGVDNNKNPIVYPFAQR